jgi:hypothetical protein
MGLFDKIFGGSKSSSQPSTVWGPQGNALSGLYKRAGTASQGGTLPGFGIPQMGSFGAQPGTGQQPMGVSQDPLGMLGGQLLGQGMGMAGNLASMGQIGNPFTMAQLGQYGTGLGRMFQQSVLPGIDSTFGRSGGFGGDRHALAYGQAAEGLGQAFNTGALDLLGNSAGMALQANQAGLGSLGGLFGLGNASMFGSLPGLQSLLSGGPTVLGGGSSSSQTPGVLGGLGALFGGG